MIPPRMGIGEGAGDPAQGEQWVLHPVWQQDLDQAPLWRPPRRPAWFYTMGLMGVPHSQLLADGEESCPSSRHPTHSHRPSQGLIPMGNWIYPGGESARRHPALILPLGVAGLYA